MTATTLLMNRLSRASKVTFQPVRSLGTSVAAPRMTESPMTSTRLSPGDDSAGDGSGSGGSVDAVDVVGAVVVVVATVVEVVPGSLVAGAGAASGWLPPPQAVATSASAARTGATVAATRIGRRRRGAGSGI